MSALDRDKIAIVIPAHNESATIAQVVERALNHHPHIIVVDDGSDDSTSRVLNDYPVTLLRNQDNLGKAASLWYGMQHALKQGYNAVITLDGDGQHPPEEIPAVLTAAAASPGCIVIGSRLRHQENVPPLRLFANRMANFWISWAAGSYISDTQSGFRYYPGELLKQVDLKTDRQHGFVFESEILIEAAWRGFGCQPVTIDAIYFNQARPSHYRPATDTLMIIRMIAWRLFISVLNPVGLIRVIHQMNQRRLSWLIGR